jgi:hypothetical protein
MEDTAAEEARGLPDKLSPVTTNTIQINNVNSTLKEQSKGKKRQSALYSSTRS